MDKHGIRYRKNVFVKLALDGMVIFVKNIINVLVVVSMIKTSNFVFVSKDRIGMAKHVWFNLNVVVDKDGI